METNRKKGKEKKEEIMFNKNPKKLTNLAKDDLVELNRRNELINQHILTAQALDLQKRFWLNDILQKLGLEPNRQYEVNVKDGAVTEKINEPQKNQGTT